jgi:hypothetical protein
MLREYEQEMDLLRRQGVDFVVVGLRQFHANAGILAEFAVFNDGAA